MAGEAQTRFDEGLRAGHRRRARRHADRRRRRQLRARQAERREAELCRREQERLGEARKLEAVGALAASVAHDVNNALSIIMTYVVLVLDELKPGDPLRSDLEEAREAASRATLLNRKLAVLGSVA